MSSTGRVSALAVLAALVLATALDASPRLRVVTDPVTGFAAKGFDPVAYFALGGASEGASAFETIWAGAAWRFVNEGNRAAFVDAPEVYAPGFGGHCAVAVARGFLAEGDPRLWTIHEGRLYFFHSEANRQAFAMDPEGFVAQAQINWPEIAG